MKAGPQWDPEVVDHDNCTDPEHDVIDIVGISRKVKQKTRDNNNLKGMMDTMAATNKRIGYVDAAKGILMMIVMLYHIIATCPLKEFLSGFGGPVVCAFFILSGYFFRSGAKSFGENVRRRAKTLMIPFLVYSLVLFAIGAVIHLAKCDQTPQEVLCCLRNYFGGCIWNRSIQNLFGWDYNNLGKNYMFLADYWFLLALFMAEMLFLLIERFALRSPVRGAICAVLLPAVTGVLLELKISLPYNLHMTPLYALLILIGAWAGKTDFPGRLRLPQVWQWIISALLFAGVSVLFGALIEPFATQIFRGTLGDNAIPKMLLLIAGSSVFGFSLLNMLRLLESNGLKLKVTAWIGKHSLQFFALHTFFMWLIAQAVNYPLFNTEGQDPKTLVALSLLIFLISVGLCALYCMISSWIKRRPLKK